MIEIKDYEVVKKEKVNLPEGVEKIVRCINPKCVTNNQHVPTSFKVTEDYKGNMKLFCKYCEKTMAKELSKMSRKELLELRDNIDKELKNAEERERQEALKAA